MKIIDITIPMRPGLAVWPGDTPYNFQRTLRKEDGNSVIVGAAHLSMHTGTHADAPFHFDSNAKAIDAIRSKSISAPARLLMSRTRKRSACQTFNI